LVFGVSTERDDGGPAFPSIAPEFDGIDSNGVERWSSGPSGGMGLRDHFAGQAMAALLADGKTMWVTDKAESVCARVSRMAYEMADAMIAERKK
jgi:hypothetical protein